MTETKQNIQPYTWFYISQPIGNNAFSYTKRKQIHTPKLWVPPLIHGDLEDVQIGGEIVFEEIESGLEKNPSPDSIQSCHGLKHFVYIRKQKKDIYIFDNHNHALYFWSLHPKRSVVHIDQHSDMRVPEQMFGTFKSGLENLESGLQKNPSPDSKMDIFHYVNDHLNIGNFIVPALQMGCIESVLQITGSHRYGDALYVWEDTLIKKDASDFTWDTPIILDLDLDYFAPEMDFIPLDLRWEIVHFWLEKADVVTIATSPYFLDQTRVSWLLDRIFSNDA